MPLPYVQVRDLPPSASFYSAVMQPLGLKFISANSASIVFGAPDAVFEVKGTPAGTAGPRQTRLVFSAGSPAAVAAFHAAAKRAHPGSNAHIADGSNGESRASATDLEGNIMEIIYGSQSAGYAHSSTKPATRVLSWNVGAPTPPARLARSTTGAVAVSKPSSQIAARPATRSVASSRPGLATIVPTDDDPARTIKRSLTMPVIESSSPQQQSKSTSPGAGAVVGTVLGAVAAGVAVGAGLSYIFSSKKEKEPTFQPHELEAPAFQRRASYHPGQQQPRYMEMERTTEKVRYPESYFPETKRYSQLNYTPPSSKTTTPIIEEFDDSASHHSSDSRTRGRSTGTATREPLMITELAHKSSFGSRKSDSSRTAVDEDESRSRAGSKRESRGREQSKPPNPKAALHAELFKRNGPKAPSRTPSRTPSRASSQAPDNRSRVSSSRPKKHGDSDEDEDRQRRGNVVGSRQHRSRETGTTRPPVTMSSRSKAPSRASSQVSSRRVPTSSKEATWKGRADDSDKASVAPSDSISCAGERPKPHARDLPFLVNRERIMIQ